MTFVGGDADARGIYIALKGSDTDRLHQYGHRLAQALSLAKTPERAMSYFSHSALKHAGLQDI